jgi:hypothetical protein
MNGWWVALLLVVAVLALLAAWRAHRDGAQARQREEETVLALHQAQEELEQQRASATLGDALADVADRLVVVAPATTSPASSAGAVQAYAEHRRRVRDYDEAVQYCLQPVELMPAADDADLDRLLKYVGDARKRLFAARAKLFDDGAMDRLAGLLEPTAAPAPAGNGLVEALGRLAATTRGHDDTDAAALLQSAMQLTRARSGDALEVELQCASSLPPIAPAPWLAPALLRLLSLVAGVAGADGQIAVRAQVSNGHIEIDAHGQPQRSAPLAAHGEFEAALEDMQQRMDERGIALEPATADPRSRGFVLRLPLASAASA